MGMANVAATSQPMIRLVLVFGSDCMYQEPGQDQQAWDNCLAMMIELGKQYASGEIQRVDLKPLKKQKMAALLNKKKGQSKPRVAMGKLMKRPASAPSSPPQPAKAIKQRPAAAPSGGQGGGEQKQVGAEGGEEEEEAPQAEEEGEEEESPGHEDCLAEVCTLDLYPWVAHVMHVKP